MRRHESGLFFFNPDSFFVAYFAGSPRWAGLGTSRGIWRRTLCNAFPGERYPTAVPRTRSSKWASWLSTPQNCVGWYRRWDIWVPGGSSYRRDSSTWAQKRHAGSAEALYCSLNRCEILQMNTNQFFIMEGAGCQSWRDARLSGVLNQGLNDTREDSQSLSAPTSISFSVIKIKSQSILCGKVSYYCLSSNVLLNGYSKQQVAPAEFKVLPLIRRIDLKLSAFKANSVTHHSLRQGRNEGKI